ncbi:AAA family ATPase [Streptomyces sp. NBC_00322]|uniref:ATP-binding protein n=1 Tax=Streptomyces sp. NBC_00322 TaxID=2975712 RepID=UPI002E290D09|nr:AAA family ATPase [Streptomyces sp. NBC_00322]
MALTPGLKAEDEPKLVGRDLELALIREHLRGTGDGRAVLLRGAAGIGKTRLMSAALAELGAGARVLTVKCQESGGAAYEAVRGLFAPLGLTDGDPASHPLFAGSATLADSAALALPALSADGAADGQPADMYGVMHGLYWLTASLAAERPLILAVDDLQWCDEASLRWLGFLLRRAEGLPVALLLTLRSEVEHARPDMLDEMADVASCLTVDVEPLTDDAVRDMLAAALAITPDPSLVERCMELTGGTPFLVQLVVHELRESAPVAGLGAAALGDVLGHGAVARFHLDRLTPERLAMAKALAVLESDDIEAAAALAGTTPGPAAGAVDALRAAGLLHPDSLAYRHDLMRQAVLDGTPAGEILALRERAARLLNDSGRPSDQVAVQLMHLPEVPEPWMVTVLRSAALGAEQRGAPATAGQYLSRALRHDLDDIELLSASARVLAHTDHPTALSRLEHALSLATDPRLRCRLVLQYVITSLGAQNSLRAFELVGETLPMVESDLGDSPEEQALRTVVEAMALVSGLDEKSTVRRVSERFRDHVAPPGETAEERLLLGMLCALGTLEGRPAAELVPMAERVLRVGDVSLGGWGALGATLTLYLADEIKPVEFVLTALLEHAQKRGQAWNSALASTTRAQVHMWTGNISLALADAQLAFDLVHRDLHVKSAVGPHCTLADVLVLRGDARRAEEVLDLIRRPRLDQFALESHTYMMSRARTRAALGDLEGALDHLVRCGDSLAEAGICNPVLAPWWYDAARLLAELGRHGEGRDVVDRVAPAVRRWGTSRARGMLALAGGVLTPGDSGIDELTEAARLLDNSPGRLEHARAEYLLGRRLLERGDAESARERLRRSIDIAVLCGDRLLLDQAVPALGAAGGRLRRGTESPTDALSGSERQVAERAVAGATNREIAEALFLTQRTVEFHLTSVYRKLGIRGRRELAAVLAGEPRPVG